MVVDPSFSRYTMTLILNGGIYAVPDVRGGGGINSEWSKSRFIKNLKNFKTNENIDILNLYKSILLNKFHFN